MLLISQLSFANEAAEVVLSDVKEQFELQSTLLKKGFTDAEIELKFESIFIKKLLQVRTVTPKISNLKGNVLTGLCLLINYSSTEGYPNLIKKDPKLVNIAESYALSIQNEVSENIKQTQSVLGGTGCNIGGAGGICPFKDKAMCLK